MTVPAMPDTIAVVGNSLIGHGLARNFVVAGHCVVAHMNQGLSRETTTSWAPQ